MKAVMLAAALGSALLLCACQGEGGSAVVSEAMNIDGKDIYLRGEMNDYAVMSSYRLNKVDENTFCTVAPLRSDWAPYRFKFADAAWSDGANFGYVAPPGVIHEDGPKVRVHASSRFEELSFTPDEDGKYRFCLIKDSEGYYVSVSRTSETLTSLHDLLFNTDTLFTKI